MNLSAHRIVIGIGSHHGDDAIGWHVVDRLTAMGIDDWTLRRSQNPLEILDCLDDWPEVHIVDAAIGMEALQHVSRLEYADPVDRAWIRNVRTMGSHDATVSFALSIANSLKKRTNHVTLWLAKGQCFEPYSDLSKIGEQSVECCMDAIAMELCRARNVAR